MIIQAWRISVGLALVGALVTGCATVETPPTVLPELRPGYVAGYLQPNELPDATAIVPPPPAPGSASLAADLETYRATRALSKTPRWQQAALDAELLFPEATGHFACAVGIGISAEATPHLNMLLRRVRMDSSRANDKPKEHYARRRPFMDSRDTTCTPKEQARMKADSYPSGHASIGWAWALVLAEAAPERADAILARGVSYGQSRVVCGVHYQSDVEAGRIVGGATVARLRSNAVFNAQLAEARKEIAAARFRGSKPQRDCAAEAKALALDR